MAYQGVGGCRNAVNVVFENCKRAAQRGTNRGLLTCDPSAQRLQQSRRELLALRSAARPLPREPQLRTSLSKTSKQRCKRCKTSLSPTSLADGRCSSHARQAKYSQAVIPSGQPYQGPQGTANVRKTNGPGFLASPNRRSGKHFSLQGFPVLMNSLHYPTLLKTQYLTDNLNP